MTFTYPRSRLLALLSALTLLFTLAACDSDDGGEDATDDVEQAADSDVAQDPETALKEAVAAIGDWDGVELTMSFQADDTARASILAESPEDEEFIDLFLDASIRMIAVGDEDDGAFQLAVTIDGTDVIEVYATATGETLDDLALRVDLPTIAELADDPEMQGEIDALVAQAGLFGLQDAAQALRDGEWIAIEGLNELAEMAEGFDDSAAEGDPDEQQIEDATQALADRTERLVDDVEVSHVGSDDAGEQLRVIADGAALQSYLEDVTEILANNDLLEGVTPEEVQRDLDDIPADTEIGLDVWISDGELRQVAIDLAEIEDSEVDGEFLLLVTMRNHTAELSAPSVATTVDVMSLFGQFMGGMAFDDFAFESEDTQDEAGSDGEALDDGFDELSQEELEMMLSFMECVTEEELEGFALMMPELADAAEQAIEDGVLEYC